LYFFVCKMENAFYGNTKFVTGSPLVAHRGISSVHTERRVLSEVEVKGQGVRVQAGGGCREITGRAAHVSVPGCLLLLLHTFRPMSLPVRLDGRREFREYMRCGVRGLARQQASAELKTFLKCVLWRVMVTHTRTHTHMHTHTHTHARTRTRQG